MLFKLLISIFLAGSQPSSDSTQAFQRQLWKDLHFSLQPPSVFDSSVRCYHFTELLKVKIDKASKVRSIELSDSAPGWLKEDMDKLKAKSKIDFKKLDSLAVKAKLKDCFLLFPLIIETDDYPCGYAEKKRNLQSNYFQFSEKYLKGNILFGEQIIINFSTRYRY